MTAILSSSSRRLPISKLGPTNPLPCYRFMQPPKTFGWHASLTESDREGLLTEAHPPLLPYTLLDAYERTQSPGDLDTLVLENNKIRAVFYPSLGGRLASLFYKKENRELLFDNPVIQPANLALRNAWFSGGVEWNSPIYGHSPQTMSPVFAARLETPRGPLLRLYEYDRLMGLVWQVDAMLPDEAEALWVHVALRNPNVHPCEVYWWTNIAMPQSHDTRVLCQTDHAILHRISQEVARVPFPQWDGFDGSYPGRYPGAESVFTLPSGPGPVWQAAIERNGRGLAHLSSRNLYGRKLFTWGGTEGGRHWMDFLSRPGEGDYLEIQGGITATQLHTRPLAAGAVLEWTECFAPLALDPGIAHDTDYIRACDDAAKTISQNIPHSRLAEIDSFFRDQRDLPTGTLLHRGAAWGMLAERLDGRTLASGLDFKAPIGQEERPWSELTERGTFTPQSLDEDPVSFNVSTSWVAALESSAAKYGDTWLHRLHLGVAALEDGRGDLAETDFVQSYGLRRNMGAARNIALIQDQRGDISSAWEWYQRAFQSAPGHAPLAAEIATWLCGKNMDTELIAFTQALPENVRGHERIRIACARAALTQGRLEEVRALFQAPFATIREGEKTLSDLWFDLHRREAEARLGRALGAAEWDDVMQRHPPPTTIDFRMTVD